MKHSESRPAVFFRTFAVSIAAAAAAFLLGWRIISSRPGSDAPPNETRLLPDASSRLTVLALGVGESEELTVCALVSFQPDLIAVQTAVLPPETVWSAGGEQNTLAAAYRQGGADYLRRQLSAWLGVPIDGALVQNRRQLSAVMDTCGPLPFTLTAALSGETSGHRVSFPPGEYRLDGAALADLLTLQAPADPARRSDRAAELLGSLIRQHLPAVLTESGEALVGALLSHSQSDLSLLDYLERRTALCSLAGRPELPVYCVYLDGTVGQEGYYLSEVSLTCLRAAFPAE